MNKSTNTVYQNLQGTAKTVLRDKCTSWTYTLSKKGTEGGLSWQSACCTSEDQSPESSTRVGVRQVWGGPSAILASEGRGYGPVSKLASWASCTGEVWVQVRDIIFNVESDWGRQCPAPRTRERLEQAAGAGVQTEWQWILKQERQRAGMGMSLSQQVCGVTAKTTQRGTRLKHCQVPE